MKKYPIEFIQRVIAYFGSLEGFDQKILTVDQAEKLLEPKGWNIKFFKEASLNLDTRESVPAFGIIEKQGSWGVISVHCDLESTGDIAFSKQQLPEKPVFCFSEKGQFRVASVLISERPGVSQQKLQLQKDAAELQRLALEKKLADEKRAEEISAKRTLYIKQRMGEESLNLLVKVINWRAANSSHKDTLNMRLVIASVLNKFRSGGGEEFSVVLKDVFNETYLSLKNLHKTRQGKKIEIVCFCDLAEGFRFLQAYNRYLELSREAVRVFS